MKKVLCLILAAVMVFALVACGGNSGSGNNTQPAGSSDTQASQAATDETAAPEAPADVEKTVTVGIGNDPVSFAPWESSSAGRNAIMDIIYQKLICSLADADTGVYSSYNVLMKDYEHEGDSKEYTVHIFDGIFDANGNPVKAEDVKFSFDSSIESGNNSNVKSLKSVEVIDDTTLKFTFEKALMVGQFEAALDNTYIVSKASFEASSDGMATTPVGTSGYVLTDYKTGSSFTLEKAENGYWNQAANDSKSVEDGYCFLYQTDNVDTIKYEIITDSSTMAVALQRHEIDIAATVSTADSVLFREGGESADEVTLSFLPAATMVIVPNCSENSAMSNLNLRKALLYSFKTEDVLIAGYGQDYYQCDSSANNLNGDYIAPEAGKDYYGYDEAKAKEYLDKYFQETGTTANDLHLVLLCSNKDEAYKKGAQIIMSYFCKLVGNDNAMEIVCLDDTTYKSTYTDPNAFDFALDYEGTEQLYSASIWERKLMADYTSDGFAQFFIDDPELQDLLVKAATVSTYSKENVKAVEDLLEEQAYRVAIGYGTTYRASLNWITKVVRGPHNCIAIAACEFDWNAK